MCLVTAVSLRCRVLSLFSLFIDNHAVLGEDDQTLRESVDGVLDVTIGYPSKRENPQSDKVRPSIGECMPIEAVYL